jgi:Chaperone of endosialidase
MKIIHSFVGASCLAFVLGAANVHAQNVGVGLSNPQAKLTVLGSLAVGDSSFNVPLASSGSSTNANFTTNEAIFQGAVGIGTTNPTQYGRLCVLNDGGGNDVHDDIALVSFAGASQEGPVFSFYAGQGTAASPTTLVNGNLVGGIGWWNVTSSGPVSVGSISTSFTGSGSTNSSTIKMFAAGPAGGTNLYMVGATGNVGINQSNPLAPLHVGTTANIIDTTTARSYFFSGSSVLTHDSSSNEANNASAIFGSTIWVAGDIVSYNGTINPSDARLKNIIGPSDSAKDLEILKKIEVTDYTMKDTVKFGQKPFKKVIAQQVDEVYPTAVTSIGIKGFTFTPDIYAISDSIKMDKPDVYLITLAKAHDLKDGDTVRLIRSKNPELTLEAHVVNDKTFTVETKEPLGDKVFVYGKECTDLKAVDYEAISMLNVSATQELAKEVETLKQQNSDLKNEAKQLTVIEGEERAKIAEQDKKIAALQAENAKLIAIAAKIERLEKIVATIQKKENDGVRTVALEQ